MAEFRYRAIDSYGAFHKGIIQANNELEVERRLENQGLDLISCKQFQRRTGRFFRGEISRREMINMVFHLEQLTSSGVPIIEGLSDLRDSVPDPYFRDVLAGVVESIEGGSNFSNALAQFPHDFDEVFVNLVRVGEEAGELPKVLHEMGNTMRRSDELIANARRVMMYPTIVGVVILAVSAFLLLYLVPRIIPFVKEMGGVLPFHTIALLAASDFVAAYWWVILSAPLIAIVVINTASRTRPELRYAIDAARLRIPIFGPMGMKTRLSRFATYMALLYGSGVTVLRSIEICESLLDNSYLEKAVGDAKRAISDGRTMSEGFTETRLFPPLVVRMIKVGETTGRLDDALLNVSYFYDREVRETIEMIEPAISPFLTVTMGTLLGWIMISVLGPLWSAATGIH